MCQLNRKFCSKILLRGEKTATVDMLNSIGFFTKMKFSKIFDAASVKNP